MYSEGRGYVSIRSTRVQSRPLNDILAWLLCPSERPLYPRDVAVLVDVHNAVPQLGGVVPAVLVGGLHPKHLGEVLAHEARRQQVIDPRVSVVPVPEMVDVPSEKGLHTVLLHEVEEPRPRRLVYVVVVVGLTRLIEVWRVVAEDVDTFARALL